MTKMNEKQERTWAMLCHLGAFAGLIFPFANIFAPLVIWLIKKDESLFVEDQGKESLNFQISMTIYCVVAAILTFGSHWLVCISWVDNFSNRCNNYRLH